MYCEECPLQAALTGADRYLNSTCACAVVKTALLVNLFSTDPDKTCESKPNWDDPMTFIGWILTWKPFDRGHCTTLSLGAVC